MPARALVLLATYNGREWVEEQIRSILSQVEVNLVQILIRDDFSSDGTVKYLEEVFGHDARIRIIKSSKPSGFAGKNFVELIKECDLKGVDYVALADQDDIWFPDKLIRAIKVLQTKNYQGYSSSVKAFWGGGRSKVLRQSSAPAQLDFIFEGGGQGCTFVIPSGEFEVVQEFCRQKPTLVSKFYFHDWLIYLIIRVRGGSWFFDASPSMLYRQHEFNDMGARVGFSAVMKRLSLIYSGWYKKQINLSIKLSLVIQPSNIEIVEFLEAFKNSTYTKLCYLILINSRRRMLDRIVILIGVIFGWIVYEDEAP